MARKVAPTVDRWIDRVAATGIDRRRLNGLVADAGEDRQSRIPGEARIGLGEPAAPEGGAATRTDLVRMAAGLAQAGPVRCGTWSGDCFMPP